MKQADRRGTTVNRYCMLRRARIALNRHVGENSANE